MELLINGESRTVAEPMSILDLLAQHSLDAKMVVVEHNRVIVPRDCYDQVILEAGDEVEIVQMMAGG
jgi:sulfur carrier protein